MAQALVGRAVGRLRQLVALIQSVHRWQGKVEQNDQRLVDHQDREVFPALKKRVKKSAQRSDLEIIGLLIIEERGSLTGRASRVAKPLVGPKYLDV